MVKDGTVTALLKGVKLEGQGEAHSAAVAAELEAALKLKAQVPVATHGAPPLLWPALPCRARTHGTRWGTGLPIRPLSCSLWQLRMHLLGIHSYGKIVQGALIARWARRGGAGSYSKHREPVARGMAGWRVRE